MFQITVVNPVELLHLYCCGKKPWDEIPFLSAFPFLRSDETMQEDDIGTKSGGFGTVMEKRSQRLLKETCWVRMPT